MSEQTFAPGDTVYLQSGGPKMTVDKVEEDRVHLVWFDDKKKELRREILAKHLLFKDDGSYP